MPSACQISCTTDCSWLACQGPYLQTFIATLVTWSGTALGAISIYLVPMKGRSTQKFLDASLGFAAGMMLCASFLSMLTPALELCKTWENWRWFPVALGFGVGCGFVYLGTVIVEKVLGKNSHDSQLEMMVEVTKKDENLTIEDVKNSSYNVISSRSYRRIMALVLAITIHNIPEGLVVGVGFASENISTGGAVTLAVALQNFPEGLAVAMPLAASGMDKLKAFFWGQASGLVEPIFGLVAVFIVGMVKKLLPYALSFSAGCMTYVVIDDIIPDANERGNGSLASVCAGIGFIFMMACEIGLEEV